MNLAKDAAGNYEDESGENGYLPGKYLGYMLFWANQRSVSQNVCPNVTWYRRTDGVLVRWDGVRKITKAKGKGRGGRSSTKFQPQTGSQVLSLSLPLLLTGSGVKIAMDRSTR